MKFDTIFRTSVEKIQVLLNMTRIRTVMIISLIILGMRKILDRSCGEIQNTYFMLNNLSPSSMPFMR